MDYTLYWKDHVIAEADEYIVLYRLMASYEDESFGFSIVDNKTKETMYEESDHRNFIEGLSPYAYALSQYFGYNSMNSPEITDDLAAARKSLFLSAFPRRSVHMDRIERVNTVDGYFTLSGCVDSKYGNQGFYSYKELKEYILENTDRLDWLSIKYKDRILYQEECSFSPLSTTKVYRASLKRENDECLSPVIYQNINNAREYCLDKFIPWCMRNDDLKTVVSSEDYIMED